MDRHLHEPSVGQAMINHRLGELQLQITMKTLCGPWDHAQTVSRCNPMNMQHAQCVTSDLAPVTLLKWLIAIQYGGAVFRISTPVWAQNTSAGKPISGAL